MYLSDRGCSPARIQRQAGRLEFETLGCSNATRSFSQIGRVRIGLSAADTAFLRDMQFHVGVGPIVMIHKTEKWGGPTFSPNPANRPARPLALAILVKLCGLQSSLTKLFSSPKGREAAYR